MAEVEIVKIEAIETICISDDTPDEIRALLQAFGFPAVQGEAYRITIRRSAKGLRTAGERKCNSKMT